MNKVHSSSGTNGYIGGSWERIRTHLGYRPLGPRKVLACVSMFFTLAMLTVQPSSASAAPHTLTPNPTCQTDGPLQGCVQAYEDGLTFSWSGYSTRGSGEVVVYGMAAEGSPNTTLLPHCGGAQFSVTVPLSAGEYVGSTTIINGQGGTPYKFYFDLEVGGSNTATAPPTSCPSPPLPTQCYGLAVIPITGLSASYASTGGPVNGYWKVGSAGGVSAFGSANSNLGSMGNCPLNQPITGMVSTPDGGGYWLVARDGGIFAFGDAGFHGSTGSLVLNQPVVSMAPTNDNQGYWLVARDGGIFAFGDAQFYGSTGSMHLNKPIVGMAATPDGGGYWLVASDGGLFAFGDAGFYGSTGSIHLNQPVVGMVPTSTGHGYLLVAADGGVFAFGDAPFNGSKGGSPPPSPIIGVVEDNQTGGYWLESADGTTYPFGGAPQYG
jgi:hypothetical protein